MTNSRPPLQHLPKWHQNAIYIAALSLSLPINLAIAALTLRKVGRPVVLPQWLPIASSHAMPLASILLQAILALLVINLVRTLLLRHRRIRGTLLCLGVLVTASLMLNIVRIGHLICTVPVIDATYLLAASALAYCSITLTFLFWYWFIDYPTQVRHLHHQDNLCAIVFPREAVLADARWLPNPLDYLYLTLMINNTLGPPENHTPVSRSIKLVQLWHSTTTMILLVLVVSRAINTLHQP
jgi:hypothetical protein